MMKRYITVALLLALALVACQKRSALTPEERKEESSTQSERKEVIKLEKPIVLQIGVTQPEVLDGIKPSGRNTTRNFSTYYNETARKHASVNTSDKSKVNTGDPELDKLIKEAWPYIKGYDYICSLSIPELNEDDYRVEGLVPVDLTDGLPGKVDESKPIPEKVTITIYSIPNGRTMTLLANSMCYQAFFDKEKHIGFLKDYNSFIVTKSPTFQLTKEVCNDFMSLTPHSNNLGGYQPKTVFAPTYLPMYGKIYNINVDNTGNGFIGSDREDGTPYKIQNIYLERAVAAVYVTWEHETSSNYLKPGDSYFSGDYLFENVNYGLFVNLTSFVPNKREEIRDIARSRMDYRRITKESANGKIPFYWHYLDGDVTPPDNKDVYTKLSGDNSTFFFVSENSPRSRVEQNSLYVELSKFRSYPDPTGNKEFKYEFVGERGTYKFELPYGEENSKWHYYDVRRNTFYNIHLKIKRLADGPQPYIVSDWTEVDLPAEL